MVKNIRYNIFAFRAATAAALCAAVLLAGTDAYALGTASGTQVGNTATALYSIGGVTQPLVTSGPSATFTVDNKVNLTVVANTANVSVIPGSTDRVLVFSVTNNGNTTQAYGLSVVSHPTDSFDMTSIRIYRDNNNDGLLDGGDTQYLNPTTFGNLVSDATLTVLVAADTPAALASGATAVQDLLATTYNAGGGAVTQQTTTATAGVDVVFADNAGSDTTNDLLRDGRHSAFATYTVTGTAVIVGKAVTVIDQSGGSNPVAGATLRYAITVTVSGGGTATGVVITDPIPANTTYLAGTLRLNGAPLTDGIDIPVPDAGDVGATTPGTVTVNLGNLTAATPAQTIVFDVRIN